MNKYYTRACNFYYGETSKKKLKEKSSIPLNGSNLISFDKIEIIDRKKSKIINLKDVDKLPKKLKNKEDLKVEDDDQSSALGSMGLKPKIVH